MKIAFLNPTGEIGGAEQVLIDVLRGVRESKPEWELHLIAGAAGPLVERVASLGIPVHLVPLPSRITRFGDSAMRGPAGRQTRPGRLLPGMALSGAALPAYMVRIRRVLAALGPDLIHTNGLKMHLIGCWARPAGTPVVWHIHDYVSARALMAPLLKRSAGQCAAACAISISVLRDLHSLFDGSLNVWPVHNGVDLDEFMPEGRVADLDALAHFPPAPDQVVRVGLVATMARWKGHRIFLRAISQLPPELPVRAYVVGGAIYRTRGSQETVEGLREFAAELGISDRVAFTGLVADAPSIMRALDVVVHASTEPEPFGLVIAQGMACGRAVIATRNAGAAEMIRFGEDALDHVPGDVAGLSKRIREVAADADLRRRLGRNARQTALMWFNRSRMTSELIRLYREIVPSKVSPGINFNRHMEAEA